MNAAPPILQAQPSSDAVQPNAPASTASPSTRAGSQDFASALSDAGGKPVRKNAAPKQQDPTLSGSPLPAPGNQPPPELKPPPPAKPAVSATAPAAVADATAIKGSPADGPGALRGAIAAASAGQANSSAATTILTAGNLDPAPSPGPATSVDAGIPPSDTAQPTVPDSGLNMPQAASMRTLTPGTSTVIVAAVPAGNAGASSEVAASQAKIASAESTPSAKGANPAFSDSTLSKGPAAAGADATTAIDAAAGSDAAAQAVMAAALAQGAHAPSPDPTSSDDSLIPDTGAPQGAMPSNPAAGAIAAAQTPALAAATSAAVTTARAASVAQAVSAAANASAVDKRSHDNSPDSPLSGAGNNGSAGAAQLLTSNTASTDAAPLPTFKVAAGVDTAQFGQGVAERVSLMMDGNLTSAKLQVNPPALGPIEVRIALQGGHAQVWLSSHSAVTRDALESSSPKLREMLGSQGFSQVSVDISQRSFQERSPQSQAYEIAPAIGADAPTLAHAPLSRGASGLLDAYA